MYVELLKLYSLMRQVVKKGFIKCFLKVPLACLGSRAAEVQPNGPWNSRTPHFVGLPSHLMENVFVFDALTIG